jgi:F0F1-type ATP synthase membrane subunit b/b'
MALHNNRSLVAQRLTNLFRPTAGPSRHFDDSQPTSEIAELPWDEAEVLPRFPFARNGYHCATVDGHVAELEQELAEVDRELAELRAQSVPRDEVSSEIKRIGEQTSAVLIAANEQRDEMLRAAHEEADRCVTEARARATLLTSEAEARLRELQAQHHEAERQRDRLLDDVRNVSAALAALADSSGGEVAVPASADITATDARSPTV